MRRARAHARQGRALLPVKQDLLGLRAQARRAAAVGTVVGLPRVRCAPRPRRQRRSEHSHGGEARPLQHGRYRGARGNRGGYSRLNARGEDVRPEGTVTVPDGRPRRTENPLVSTMGSVNIAKTNGFTTVLVNYKLYRTIVLCYNSRY